MCIFYSEEVFDWEDEDDRKPRPNPFNDDTGSFELVDSNATWVSQKEVADFMKQSRGLSLGGNNADDDEDLGVAWGGPQYSIASGTAINIELN